MTNLCVIGHLAIDDIRLPGGITHTALLGGSAVYAAVGASVWSRGVIIAARKGSDFPVDLLDQLESYGISLDLHPVMLPSIRGSMIYKEDGRRNGVPHDGSGSTNELSILPNEIPTHAMHADAFHIASMPTKYQVGLARALKGHGKLVTLDPHPDIGLFKDILLHALQWVDVFLPSLEQVEFAFGHQDAHKAALEFAEAGPRVVVVKLGRDGSLVYRTASKVFTHVPIFNTKSVDPSGAGDAYCGGFLVCYATNQDPVLSAIYGTVSASYVVEHFGALAPLEVGFEDAHQRLKRLTKDMNKNTRADRKQS